MTRDRSERLTEGRARSIWNLYFKFKGRLSDAVSSRLNGYVALDFFNVRRWGLAIERGSDSERAIERHAACSTEGEDAALFFSGFRES